MDPRDGYLSGVPCWLDTAQPDPVAATQFYGGLFGWEFEDRMPPDAPGQYCVARLDGLDVAGIGSQPDDGVPTPSWATYVAVDDADATTTTIARAGGTVTMAPFDIFDDGRMAVFSDPAGAELRLWQAGKHHGSQLVNAPGSWNFSDLSTPDPEGAEAFYGAVFGWQVLTIPMGESDATMWTRPGYGDDLERLEPGLRQRQGEMGAPIGFEDVVASFVVLGPSDSTARARWDVTFAVDDADATAARAAELGGTVCVEPQDAGPVRTSTLADPAGAVFTVARFYPERLAG